MGGKVVGGGISDGGALVGTAVIVTVVDGGETLVEFIIDDVVPPI